MKKISIWLLAVLLAMPCILHAEEIEIQLMEVIGMGVLPGGDGPLDNPTQSGEDPTRPTDFRATINGNSLTVLKQDANIPVAQATVVNASTGSIVLSQQFTTSINEQIANTGVYVLHIETAGGALVGQFIVQ
jgi:curli biogenesis system outer membrane secretion channel CsgG